MKQQFAYFFLVLSGLVKTTPLSSNEVIRNVKSLPADSFVAYDKAPELIGGYVFIKKNLQYPDSARRNCVQADVIVTIVLNELGNVIEAVPAVDDKGWGFNEAAIALVRKTKWVPPSQNGKPSKCRITIPISFKLK